MNTEQINELRKLADAATPGPWIKRGYVLGIGCGVDGVTAVAHHTTSADADFIAAANPAAILSLIQQRDELLAALKSARRAIGDHYAPDDCYATGQLTGDDFLDLVQCPACAFLELHNAVTAKCEAQS